MSGEKPSKTFFPLGVILFVSGFVVNTIFMLSGIVGYLRELTRLITIVGFLLIIVGLIQRLIRRIKKQD